MRDLESECHNTGKHSGFQMLTVLHYLSESIFVDLASTGTGTVKPPVMLQCYSRFPQLVGQIRADITFPW